MERNDSKKEIYDLIIACYNCQPYEEGEPVWVLGDRMTVDELLDELDIPSKSREQIIQDLSCPSCGTKLFASDDIGILSKEEREFFKKMEIIKNKYDPKLIEFYNFLEQYPYLGVAHSLGKKIYNSIGNFEKINLESEIWFRARRITDGKNKKLKDFLPPDPKAQTIDEGRYNHFGQSHFYLASTEEAALLEVIENGEKNCWTQKFEVSVNNVLDLRDISEPIRPNLPLIAYGLIFSGTLEKQIKKSECWKPEYFIPRFIADCAKNQGLNGIIFHSEKHMDDNLVIFDISLTKIKPIGKPKISCYKKITFEEIRREVYHNNDELPF